MVRHGSVKGAAQELGVSEAAVSMHVTQLRKELDDELFVRTGTGIAFTPGGLRLASRAAEILGLHRQAREDVSQAQSGRRLLRISASSMFAEHAAPGLIELFTKRATDLDVELSVGWPVTFEPLLVNRKVDVAIGPEPRSLSDGFIRKDFLAYSVVAAVGPEHRFAGRSVSVEQLSKAVWLLGPAAFGTVGLVPRSLNRLGVPEQNRRIFQSDAAAVEEAKRTQGLVLTLAFSIAADIKAGRLVKVGSEAAEMRGTWAAVALPQGRQHTLVSEFLQFLYSPRATQAMIRGTGVPINKFRPTVHITLWS